MNDTKIISLNSKDEPVNITLQMIAEMCNLFAFKFYALEYKNLMKLQKETVKKECYQFFIHCAERIQKEN